MYIVNVLVEHPIQKLDTTFSYLCDEEVKKGVRVYISFKYQKLIGYVESVEYSDLTKEELEKKDGFIYKYIDSIIDKEPLLNKELYELSYKLSKMTISPKIACLQAMLPPSLKPTSSLKVQIKTQKSFQIISDKEPKTLKQKQCIQYMLDHPDTLIKDIPYSKVLLDSLVKQGIIEYINKEIYRNPVSYKKENHMIQLTHKQQEVVDHIMSKKDRVSLIYGVTGSGKTEVYLELANQTLKQNKKVIMLVPEISLTPMMVEQFKKRFGDTVAILHSRLSQGERYDEYRRMSRQEVNIVVGARSAIFAPIDNIGLIILDEEHDSSYKQESQPRYLTHTIAKIRAQYHHARLVLGSATPSLESYSRAKKGIYDLYEMKERINKKPLPHIDIVDMVEEAKNKNYSLFSKTMIEHIKTTLNKNEQVILLLNKRGYSSYIQCHHCNEVVRCPHCDVSLTYHKNSNELKCHYCDYSIPYPKFCPSCHNKTFKIVGIGTQKVEEELLTLFDNAKVLRYDVDTTRNKNSHSKLLNEFKEQKANILIGTQMIAKGLDFENVTFVGVMNADLSLNIPDFRASERTFQLLCQVAGRSGRGSKEGRVIIQTYNPHHYAIECAMNHDYEKFYELEMKYRLKLIYPPYCHLVSILVESKNELLLDKCSDDIKSYLDNHLSHVKILGPTMSMIYKLNDTYRKRILIKFKDSKPIYEVVHFINDYYNKKLNRKVRVICDFNPYSQI